MHTSLPKAYLWRIVTDICCGVVSSVLLKCPRMLLHVLHRRLFQSVPAFSLLPWPSAAEVSAARSAAANVQGIDLSTSGLQSSASPAPSFLAAADCLQRAVVHVGVTCARCHERDIRGVCYRCANCLDFSICAKCEVESREEDSHPSWHVFLQLRRPLVASSSASMPQLPMNLVYPTALTGAPATSLPAPPQANLQSEWFFLTVATLRSGLLRTCSRYTTLVQQLDAESNPRQIESLLKAKLCVDAQLLHPTLLISTLRFYVGACAWLRTLMDPRSAGLPLPTRIPMEYAAMPEYLVDDAAEFVLFLSRFSIEILAAPDVRPLLHVFAILLATPSYAPNPYLRCKLVEVLASLADNAENVQATSNKQPPPIAIKALLIGDAFLETHLVRALLQLFVNIEHTGGARAFWEKYKYVQCGDMLLDCGACFLIFATLFSVCHVQCASLDRIAAEAAPPTRSLSASFGRSC
jgi:hypothetical protein